MIAWLLITQLTMNGKVVDEIPLLTQPFASVEECRRMGAAIAPPPPAKVINGVSVVWDITCKEIRE